MCTQQPSARAPLRAPLLRHPRAWALQGLGVNMAAPATARGAWTRWPQTQVGGRRYMLEHVLRPNKCGNRNVLGGSTAAHVSAQQHVHQHLHCRHSKEEGVGATATMVP